MSKSELKRLEVQQANYNQIQHDPNFKLEPRYILFKMKDVLEYLSDSQRKQLQKIGLRIALDRISANKPDLDAVVIEKDWPEYQQVCDMIEARMTGHPNELQRCYNEINYLTNMHLNVRGELMKQIQQLEMRIEDGGNSS